MPTFVDTAPNGIVQDFTMPTWGSFNGATWEIPYQVGRATDANNATFIAAGYNGTVGGAGRVILTFPSHAALGSGQIMDGVAFYGVIDPGQTKILRQPGPWYTAVTNPGGGGAMQATAFVPPPSIVLDGTTSWTPTYFDNLEFWFEGNGLVGTNINIYECRARSRIYSRPTVALTAPVDLSTVVTTTRPTVSWTFTGDGLNQYAFRLKVFSAAQYGAGGFDPAVSTPTWDSGVVVSSTPSTIIGQQLVNGTTYRVYIAVAQRTPASLYVHWSTLATTWSVFRTFTINLSLPAAPDPYYPSGYDIISTDIPLLKAYINGSAVSNAVMGAEFQLATDVGFTANVRGPFLTSQATAVPTIVVPGGGHILSQSVSYQIPAGASTELKQLAGTSTNWYIRARAFDYTNGLYGPYSNPYNFVLLHQPSCAALSPKAGQHVPWLPSGGNGLVTMFWTFSDPSPVDFQGAFQLRVYRTSGAVLIYDSGVVSSSVTNWTATIPGADKDVALHWTLEVYDSDMFASGLVVLEPFRTRDVPTVNITSPVDPVTTPTTPISWTFTGTSGRTQQSWAVEIYETAVAPANIVHIAADIGTASSYDFTGLFKYEYGKTYQVVVTLTDSGGLSGSDTQQALASWSAPDKPTETLSTAVYDTSGYVQVSWTNASQDGEYAAYRIYRRNDSSSPWTLIGEVTNVAGSYTFNDYGAPANASSEYAVVQVAMRFGSPVESARTPVASTTTVAANYWLIHPVDPTLSVILNNVTAESISNEYEKATINVIGRGRRVERGTNYGYKGTLTCDLWDDAGGLTARQKRINIENMKHVTEHVFLRNPFGDVWQVSLDDISFTRVPGLGLREHVSMSIPYEEVG